VLAVRVVEVDVARDAVIRHRDVMGGPSPATHGGEYTVRHVLKLL
jgi:hypothetical protein